MSSYDEGYRDRSLLAEQQNVALARIARAIEHTGHKLPLAYDPKDLAAIVESLILRSDAQVKAAADAAREDLQSEVRSLEWRLRDLCDALRDLK